MTSTENCSACACAIPDSVMHFVYENEDGDDLRLCGACEKKNAKKKSWLKKWRIISIEKIEEEEDEKCNCGGGCVGMDDECDKCHIVFSRCGRDFQLQYRTNEGYYTLCRNCILDYGEEDEEEEEQFIISIEKIEEEEEDEVCFRCNATGKFGNTHFLAIIDGVENMYCNDCE
jgi:hypothetical protein